MNAERLLAHYERIADAPDAIVRLRRFVLDLAVRGKLVLQDASDEPASELLKRIANEKALKAKKQIRKLSPKERTCSQFRVAGRGRPLARSQQSQWGRVHQGQPTISQAKGFHSSMALWSLLLGLSGRLSSINIQQRRPTSAKKETY